MSERTAAPRRWDWILALLALLIVPAVALARAATLWGGQWLVIGVASVSLFTFLVYAADKSRAKAGDWRIAESVLHLLAVLGGWPGAFVAQRWLRHKNAKTGFQIVFWLTVALHEFVALDYVMGWPMTRGLVRAIGV